MYVYTVRGRQSVTLCTFYAILPSQKVQSQEQTKTVVLSGLRHRLHEMAIAAGGAPARLRCDDDGGGTDPGVPGGGGGRCSRLIMADAL